MGLKAKFIDGAVKRPGCGTLLSTIFETGLRFLQLIFGVAVIGLYAQDIDRGRKAGAAADPRWVCVSLHTLPHCLGFIPSRTFLLPVYQAREPN